MSFRKLWHRLNISNSFPIANLPALFPLIFQIIVKFCNAQRHYSELIKPLDLINAIFAYPCVPFLLASSRTLTLVKTIRKHHGLVYGWTLLSRCFTYLSCLLSRHHLPRLTSRMDTVSVHFLFHHVCTTQLFRQKFKSDARNAFTCLN